MIKNLSYTESLAKAYKSIHNTKPLVKTYKSIHNTESLAKVTKSTRHTELLRSKSEVSKNFKTLTRTLDSKKLRRHAELLRSKCEASKKLDSKENTQIIESKIQIKDASHSLSMTHNFCNTKPLVKVTKSTRHTERSEVSKNLKNLKTLTYNLDSKKLLNFITLVFHKFKGQKYVRF